jgi:hypothetical protein
VIDCDPVAAPCNRLGDLANNRLTSREQDGGRPRADVLRTGAGRAGTQAQQPGHQPLKTCLAKYRCWRESDVGRGQSFKLAR